MIEQTEAREAVAGLEQLPDGGYGPTGAALRADMADADLGPMHRLLVDEAARIVDRLDRLHAALSRKGEWLRFETDDGGTVIVQVDGVLAESRQQAATLKALIAEIRAALPKAPGRLASQPKGGGLSDLSARIAARRGTAAS